MALRQADKREFFHWMLNCLQEKLQEEVRIDSRPVQLHNAGKIYQERPEPTVRDGLQDNTTNLPTASLGGQERQNDPPNVQTETNEEREDKPIYLFINQLIIAKQMEFDPVESVKKRRNILCTRSDSILFGKENETVSYKR